MEIVAYCLIALFIAWIWVDYYRSIDIYEPEKLLYLIPTFILGGTSVFIVWGLDDLFIKDLGYAIKGEFLNDFLFCTLKIGLVEEIAKLIPFLIALVLFRKQFVEPIDYLAFICTSALGFSAVENVLYFQNYGHFLISGRAALSTVSHMFDSALIAYGIIRYNYHPKKPGWASLLFFVVLAALTHGIYDFLLYYFDNVLGLLLTVVYFMLTLSLFATIVNNALNNSPLFSYKKVVNSHKVLNGLVSGYAVIFGAEFVLAMNNEGFIGAFKQLHFSIVGPGLVMAIVSMRMSRFKLIENRWFPLKLEMPFTYSVGPYNPVGSSARIRIKGDAYNMAYIHHYYEEYFYLKPLSKRRSYLKQKTLAYLEKKVFLSDDTAYFLTRVYRGTSAHDAYDYFLLKPKTQGAGFSRKKGYPIVGLLHLKDLNQLEDPKTGQQNFAFAEWCFVVPRQAEPKH